MYGLGLTQSHNTLVLVLTWAQPIKVLVLSRAMTWSLVWLRWSWLQHCDDSLKKEISTGVIHGSTDFKVLGLFCPFLVCIYIFFFIKPLFHTVPSRCWKHFLKPNIGSRASSEKRNLTMQRGRERGRNKPRVREMQRQRKWRQNTERRAKSHLEGDRFSGVVKEDMAAETWPPDHCWWGLRGPLIPGWGVL